MYLERLEIILDRFLHKLIFFFNHFVGLQKLQLKIIDMGILHNKWLEKQI